MIGIGWESVAVLMALAFALGAGTIGILLQKQYEEKVEQIYDEIAQKR